MNVLAAFSDELEVLVARVTPAVVGIGREQGHGTGVVLAQDGYVLTNAHVAGTGRGLRVRLSTGEWLKAELVGSDPATDLAVVRVERNKLPVLPLAEKHPPAVGQLVVAVGNPLGFERSVSVGIISALDRSLPGPMGPFEGLVQTDAAINPGNSGGPLVNARGEVVGINTAVIPYAQGMGFAVNAKTATWVASVLIRQGSVPRRFLGIAARAEPLPVGEHPVSAEGTTRRAIHVLQVQSGSPAEAAGLQAMDFILAANGQPVASVDDIHRVMVLGAVETLELDLLRRGAGLTIPVKPGAQKKAA